MGVRIQELPETTGINKEDLLIVEDGQGTKKGTVQQLDETLGVSQLKEDLDAYFVVGKNLFDVSKVVQNTRIVETDGTTISATDYICSDYIEIEPNTAYVISHSSTSNQGFRYSIYSTKSESGYIDGKVNTLTVPNTYVNAKYIRFSCQNIRTKIMLIKDGESTTYEPYEKELDDEYNGLKKYVGCDGNKTAYGENAKASGKNSLALGSKAMANANGSVAIGTASDGTRASASVENQIVLGTNMHTVRIPGKLDTPLANVNATNKYAIYGDEIISDLSTFSTDGATYFDGKWSIGNGKSIYKNINVESGKTYHLTWEVDESTVIWEHHRPCSLMVSLGAASMPVFWASDTEPYVDFTATETGSVLLKFIMDNSASGVFTSVSLKEILSYSEEALKVNNRRLNISENNVSIGGHNKLSSGNRDTGFGIECQANLNTGNNNTAVGYGCQRSLTQGSYNTGVGNSAQTNITTGMYNHAFGTSSQANMTTGCWNVAVGNETQRDATTACNNVAVGRRAQNDLTEGMGNIAIGAQAGFLHNDHTGYSTKSANKQVLIGMQATQVINKQCNEVVVVGAYGMANEKGVAIGSYAEANGVESIAIGSGTKANNDKEVVIGTSEHSIILCGKKINFNSDGTVTWENG